MGGADDWPTSETDVARPFAAWMRTMEWDVYPEVQLRLSGRADMVGVRSYGSQELYHAVEVKRRFGMKVLNQAISHTAAVHYSSIVVPQMRSSSYKTRAASTVLRYWGIGLYQIERAEARSYGGTNRRGVIHLEDEECSHTEAEREEGWCSDDCHKGYRIRELEPPNLHRIKQSLIDRYVNVTERHKNAVPGNADADYWTPWRETCHRVEEFVRENPDCTTDELVEGIDHHYANNSSAKSSIVQWIRRGKIHVGIEKRGGRLHFFYPPEEDES